MIGINIYKQPKERLIFMEYTVNKEEFGVCKTVFNSCLEQSIDLDFNLPEYCPDIQKVLKCQVCPKITMRNIVGDRLNVEGIAVVSLLYLDSEKLSIRCCEHSSPFSVEFNLKASYENTIIFTDTKVEYINCRAITQRRVDIHGAFSICACVKNKEIAQIISGINDETIEQRKKLTSLSNLICMEQQQFNINETVELKKDFPPIEAVLKSDVKVLINDYRTVTNKLILNAEAILNLIYISNIETGEIKSAQFNIPVSQIVDADGIEDDCNCDIKIEVLNNDMQQRMDGNGENTLLGLDIKMIVSLLAYKFCDIEVLKDAYSTKFEVEKIFEKINLTRFNEDLQILHNEKTMIESVSQDISEILESFGEITSLESKEKDGEIIFTGKANICILALNSQGEVLYFERTVDFENKYDWREKPCDVEINSKAFLLSSETKNINGKDIEVDLNLKICASIYSDINIKAISEVIVNEEKPLSKDTSAALTIYYASKGENLWDIARKYCTSVESIKKENELESDQIKERSMILIPM